MRSNVWKDRILDQLSHYKRFAPNASKIIQFIGDSLFSSEDSISKLNVSLLAKSSDLLKVAFKYKFYSELNIEVDPHLDAEERILQICRHLGAKEYVNLPGGVSLYHPEVFELNNIKLTFRQLPTFVYPTGSYAFEPNLSIIDVLMWNSPETVKSYLDKHCGN